MEIAYDNKALASFATTAMNVSANNTILIDQYLENAIEIDVDLIRDEKGSVFIAGIMEHIEEAGIHSGDSACCLPPISIKENLSYIIIFALVVFIPIVFYQLNIIIKYDSIYPSLSSRSIEEYTNSRFYVEESNRIFLTISQSTFNYND